MDGRSLLTYAWGRGDLVSPRSSFPLQGDAGGSLSWCARLLVDWIGLVGFVVVGLVVARALCARVHGDWLPSVSPTPLLEYIHRT